MSCSTCRNNKININIVNSLLNNKTFLTEAVVSGVNISVNRQSIDSILKPKIDACFMEMATETAKTINKLKKSDYASDKTYQTQISKIAEKYVNDIIEGEDLKNLFSSAVTQSGQIDKSGTEQQQLAKANSLASSISDSILSVIGYIQFVFGAFIPSSAIQAADSAVRVTKLQKLYPSGSKKTTSSPIAPSAPKGSQPVQPSDYVPLPSTGPEATSLEEIKILIKNNKLLSEESFFDKASPISTRHLKAYQFLQKWFKTNTPKTIIKQEEKDDVYDAVKLIQKKSLHDKYGFLSVGDLDNTNGRIAPNIKQEKLSGEDAGKAIYWGAWELIHGPNKNIFEDLLKVSLEGQMEAVDRLHGREIAHFVLDIAGVIDPIGFFDGVNLGLYAQDYTKASSDEEKQQAFVGMVASAIGIAVPYVGDALLKPVKLLLETKKATEAFRIIKGFISRNSKTVLRVVEKITPRNFKPAIDDLKIFLREGELPKDQNWALQLEKRANEASLAAIEKELKSAIPTLSRMIQDNTLGLVLFQASQYVGLNKAIESLAERKVVQYVSEFIGSILKEGTEQAYYTIGTLLVIITNAENDPKVSAPNNNEINNLERKQKIYQIVREKIALSPSLSKEIKESFLTFVREIDDLIQRDIVNKKININENLKNKILINIVNKDLLNEAATVKAWKDLWTQAFEGFSRGFVKLEKGEIDQIIARASKLSVNGHLLEIKKLLKEITEEVDYSKFWSRFKAYRIYTKEAAKQFLGEAVLSNRRLITRLQDESNLIQAEINSYEKVTNSQLVMTQTEKNAATTALGKLRPAKENVDNQIKILEEQQVKLENKIKEVDQKGVPKEGDTGTPIKPTRIRSVADWVIWSASWYTVGNLICRQLAFVVAAWLAAKKTFLSPIANWFESITGQIISFASPGLIAWGAAQLRLIKGGLISIIRWISYKIAAGYGCASGARIRFGVAAAEIISKSGLTESMDTITQRFAEATDASPKEIEEALYGEFKEGTWFKTAIDAMPIPKIYGDYGKVGNAILSKTDPMSAYQKANQVIALAVGGASGVNKKELQDFAATELKDKFFVSAITASQMILIRKYLISKGIKDPELQTVFLSCLIDDLMSNLANNLKDSNYNEILKNVSSVFDLVDSGLDVGGISSAAVKDKTAFSNHIKEELKDLNEKITKYMEDKKIDIPGSQNFGNGSTGRIDGFLKSAEDYIGKLNEKGFDISKGKKELEDKFNKTQNILNTRINYYKNEYPANTEEEKRYRQNNITYYTNLKDKNQQIYDKIVRGDINSNTQLNTEKGNIKKYNCEIIKRDYSAVWQEATRMVDISKGVNIEVGDIVTYIATGSRMRVVAVDPSGQNITVITTKGNKEYNKYLFMISQKK